MKEEDIDNVEQVVIFRKMDNDMIDNIIVIEKEDNDNVRNSNEDLDKDSYNVNIVVMIIKRDINEGMDIDMTIDENGI